MQHFYSNGKLLLSGEYLVLDGATGLALPTIAGQQMSVEDKLPSHELHWESITHTGEIWFEGKFRLPELKLIGFTGDKEVALVLQNILTWAKKTNPEFLSVDQGYKVTNKLHFPRNWGLGSSSTLINNIAQWSGTDAFALLFNSFGGSGYDIACAQNDRAILYHLNQGGPHTQAVNFDPPFKDQLYFVHLNKKQVSSESIRIYKNRKVEPDDIRAVSALSLKMLDAKSISSFNTLLKEHESIVAKVLKIEPIQKRLFPDFDGQTKSLGAWGGDFILATGNESTKDYFNHKGFETVIPYRSMIKTT